MSAPADPRQPLPELRATVPATSANLGPGFDALGLALDLRMTVVMRASAEDRLLYTGHGGEGGVPDDPDNLIHAGFRAVHRAAGLEAPTVRFDVNSPIPLARGLGSSSSALVAGAALADETLAAMGHERLGKDAVFRLCAALEGHPDNVAPAVYGAFTVSAADASGSYLTASLSVPPAWRLLFGVPPFTLSTSTARAALPASYSLHDAVATSSRAALWVAAVALDQPELLRAASLDLLHQPYRAALVPGFARAAELARAAGAYAVFLSGAGPAMAVICEDGAAEECLSVLREFAGPAGQVLDLAPATGVAVERC